MTVGLAILTGCREKEPDTRSDLPSVKEEMESKVRTPQEILDEYMAKVNADHQLKECDIKSSMREDGKMTLTGRVHNKEMKNKSEQLAKTVTGVMSIDNELEITGEEMPTMKLSDRALRREFEKKLDADSQLKEFPMSVTVDDRKATVEGYVDTRDHRSKVMALGDTVAGLTEIDDKLRLSHELKDEFMAKVEADNQLKDYRIEAWMVKGNILNMAGLVPNKEYRRKAEALAKTVGGVKRIENRIEVSGVEFPPEKALSDMQLEAELEKKMAADSELKQYDISVEVERGKAVLKGTVPDHKDKKKAGKLAETVKGISKIDNRIEREKEKEVAIDRIWPRASAKYINDLL